jgi:hypothetical protein
VEGDNLAFVFWKNWQEPRVEWPYASTLYAEITLNLGDNTPLSELPIIGERVNISSGGFLQMSYNTEAVTSPLHEVGFVAIHTRRTTGNLQVSSQQIILNTANLVSQYSGADYMEMCIYSYGLDENVPLDPGEGGGRITPGGGTSAVYVLGGNGSTVVSSSAFRLQPGSYVLNAQPQTWPITSASAGSTILFVDGVTIDGTSFTLYSINQTRFAETGIPSNVPIVVPDNVRTLQIHLRADEGTSVQVSIR